MTTDTKMAGPEKERPPWFGIGIFVIVVAGLGIFLFFASNLMPHRYHRGHLFGWPKAPQTHPIPEPKRIEP